MRSSQKTPMETEIVALSMNQFTLFLTATQGRIARGPLRLDEDSEAKVNEFPPHECTSYYIPCLQSSLVIVG